MGRYIARRLALLVPLLIGVSIVTFLLIHLLPGNALELLIGVDQRMTVEQKAQLLHEYGLDASLPVQYLKWAEHVVHGDLGTSLRSGRSITTELRLRMPVTFELTLLAAIFGSIPAMLFGIVAAVRRNSWMDYLATLTTLVGVSMPNFWLATLLVLIFSLKLHWLPPIQYVPFTQDAGSNIKHMVLPAIALGAPLATVIMRQTRSAVLEMLGQDHVRVARAKGLREAIVLNRHVLRNALIPIITVLGIQIARLLGGVFIIEQIFALPGIGRLTLDAIQNRDYAIVQGTVLVIAVVSVLISLVVDVLYAIIDPRIRVS
ncbi:MAG: ABC transporter permease [Chloroflexota bacterium]|nr:ABC transporter permease [Chloroflexota bacterium]